MKQRQTLDISAASKALADDESNKTMYPPHATPGNPIASQAPINEFNKTMSVALASAEEAVSVATAQIRQASERANASTQLPAAERLPPPSGLLGLKVSNPTSPSQQRRRFPSLDSPSSAAGPSGHGEKYSTRGLLIATACIVVAIALHHLTYATSVTPAAGTLPESTIVPADVTWMLISTMSVLMMIPALGLFEAGLLRAKNSVSVLMQCFAGLAILTTLWFAVGFSLCFSPNPNRFTFGLYGSLDYAFLANVGWATALPNAPTIPGVLFVAFQGMFAAVTPLLCTGAFAERLRFEAYVAFVILWSLLVYYPLCRHIWGGGWLAQLGVVDFAGGIVIHTAAGVASLVTAIRLGPRAGFAGLSSESLAPHNIPMAATGAGLLWVGWFSFNGGSALTSGALAASTLMSTHIAGATSALAWLLLDWAHLARPTFVGVINGALSGLAGVTPAAGFITPNAGFAVGLMCGLVRAARARIAQSWNSHCPPGRCIPLRSPREPHLSSLPLAPRPPVLRAGLLLWRPAVQGGASD